MEPITYKTCKRRNTPGDTHYLTFSCFGRRPLLTRDRVRWWLVDAIWRAKMKHDFLLWAWVFMPEHVHIVIRPKREIYDISDILKSMKQPVTQAALKFVRVHSPAFLERMRDVSPRGVVTHRLWQRGGGYDSNLWTAKHIREKINYIHMNPVRRGLVKDVMDWEWSSARDLARLRDPILPLDLESMPR